MDYHRNIIFQNSSFGDFDLQTLVESWNEDVQGAQFTHASGRLMLFYCQDFEFQSNSANGTLDEFSWCKVFCIWTEEWIDAPPNNRGNSSRSEIPNPLQSLVFLAQFYRVRQLTSDRPYSWYPFLLTTPMLETNTFLTFKYAVI